MKARDLLAYYEVIPGQFLDVIFPPDTLLLQNRESSVTDGVLVICNESCQGGLDKVKLIYIHPLHFLDGAPEIVEHEVGGRFVQDSTKFIKSAFRNELIYASLIPAV